MDELKLIWLENLFDMEKIIEIMESCDKDCANCSRDEKNDCLLEMREAIHSIAIHFKSAILSMVEASRHATSSSSDAAITVKEEKATLYT